MPRRAPTIVQHQRALQARRPQLKRDSLGRKRVCTLPPNAWLQTGTGFPSGGISLETTYKSGNGSSWIYKPWFDPILGPLLGCDLYPGSLNLWADGPVGLPSPARVSIDGIQWLFAPLVVGQSAVAVAARKESFGDIAFVEVFACQHLASKLGLAIGQRVPITLYSGEHLGLAA